MPPDTPPVLVTDHALVRYMERVLGLDLSAIRAEILSERNVALALRLRNCRIPVGNWSDLVVVDARIVTVSPRVSQVPRAMAKKRR
jgi:hypothetical protein